MKKQQTHVWKGSLTFCLTQSVFCLQFWPDETLLGGETSVQTVVLLTGRLRGQHVDWRLQKGSRCRYLPEWIVLLISGVLFRTTRLTVSNLFLCISVISSWLRTSWKVNDQLVFDPELLKIKLTDRRTQTVRLIRFLHEINTDQFIDCLFIKKVNSDLTFNVLFVVYRKSLPSG